MVFCLFFLPFPYPSLLFGKLWRVGGKADKCGEAPRRGKDGLFGVRSTGLGHRAQRLQGSRCSATFPKFITSRKRAQKKEQITVPVSFSLNIEGPQRSGTILERVLEGGEEKVLWTSEEVKGSTNNVD